MSPETAMSSQEVKSSTKEKWNEKFWPVRVESLTEMYISFQKHSITHMYYQAEWLP